MYKKTIPALLILVLVALFVYERPRPSDALLPTSVERPASATTSASAASEAPHHAQTGAKSAPVKVTESTTTAATTTATRNRPAGPSISIKINDATYVTPFTESETVIDAMNAARSEGLAFIGENYPSLGFYVESINGSAPLDGYSWILYVNGKSADLGASAMHLSAGDIVEWKYEKSY